VSEQLTPFQRAAEGTARRIDRRRFLNKAAVTIFSAAVGFSVRAPSAFGTHNQRCPDSIYGCFFCNPPFGQRCAHYNTAFCNGALCTAPCRSNFKYWGDACWCTAKCNYAGYGCGYWKCCDCFCPDPPVPAGECGCTRFIAATGCAAADGTAVQGQISPMSPVPAP
jgi:hypothetical protein